MTLLIEYKFCRQNFRLFLFKSFNAESLSNSSDFIYTCYTERKKIYPNLSDVKIFRNR